MTATRFNVRVYGIFINAKQQILLSDEYRFGRRFTKFPGGGLEFGESTIACLEREAIEEIKQPIKVLEHFYTTDFFQASAFNSNDQIISIYYRARLSAPEQLATKQRRYDFDKQGDDLQAFRWAFLANLTENDLTFPIDKVVLEQLKKTHL